MKIIKSLALLLALCVAGISQAEEMQFKAWKGKVERDAMDPWVSYKTWTDGKVIQTDGPRGRKAWVRLWISCSAMTDPNMHPYLLEELRKAQAKGQLSFESELNGHEGMNITFVFKEAVAAPSLVRPDNGDEYQPHVWLKVRFDQKPSELMGFSLTRGNEVFRYARPSNFGVNLEKWKLFSDAVDAGPDDRKTDDLFNDAVKRRDSISWVKLPHLRQHRRMRIAIGLRPKTEQGTQHYNGPTSEDVVFEFSLMGVTDAVRWARQGCLGTEAETLQANGG